MLWTERHSSQLSRTENGRYANESTFVPGARLIWRAAAIIRRDRRLRGLVDRGKYRARAPHVHRRIMPFRPGAGVGASKSGEDL